MFKNSPPSKDLVQENDAKDDLQRNKQEQEQEVSRVDDIAQIRSDLATGSANTMKCKEARGH